MIKIEFKEAQERLTGRDIWITPSSYRGMRYRAQFTCMKCGHSWFARCNNVVVLGSGCPECWNARQSAAAKAAWARPDVRERMSAANKEAQNRPEVKEKIRATKARPEVKARTIAALKEALNRPEVRAKHRATNARPEVKARMIVAAKASGTGGWWRAEKYRAAGINEIFLYQIEFRIGELKIYKVGVSQDPRVRLKHIEGYSMQILSIERGTPEDMLMKEKRIKKASRPYSLAKKLPGVAGRTEMFSQLVIPE